MPPTPRYRATAALLALLTWLALGLQLYLSIAVSLQNNLGLSFTLTNFFSYFTILTNLLVAIVLTQTALSTSEWPTPGLQTAIAVNIAMVGLSYSLLLRHIWNPQGAQKVADVLLHDAVPLLYVLFWFVFSRKRKVLPWNAVVIWLIWPIIYLLYSMIRGALVGWYPYHFIDPTDLGYPRVFGMAAALIVAFVILGTAAIALTRTAAAK